MKTEKKKTEKHKKEKEKQTDSRFRVREDVELQGKTAASVDFLIRHAVQVELEALEVEDERAREALEDGSGSRVHLPLAGLAADRVPSTQPLPLDVLRESLLHTPTTLDREADVIEILWSLHNVSTVSETLV